MTKPPSDAPIVQRKQGGYPSSVVGVHYSAKGGLTGLKPSLSGSATPERGRLLRAAGGNAPALKQRVSFYVRTGDAMPVKGTVVGGSHPSAYEVRLNNLYDVRTDPEGIIEREQINGHGNDMDGLVRATLRAGYDGTVHEGVANDAPVATLFGRGTIPVKDVSAAVKAEKPRFMFAGEKAKGHDADALAKAKAAYLKGITAYQPPKESYLATELAPNPDNAAATRAWEALTPETRAEVIRDVGNDAVREVASLLGIPHGAIDNAFGGIEGTVNPNILTHYRTKKVSLDDARALASGVGRALDQKSVALIDPRASEQHAVISIRTPCDIMPNSEAIRNALRQIDPEMDGFTAKGSDLHVIDFNGEHTEQTAVALRQALHDAPFDVHIVTGHVHSELIEGVTYDSHLRRLRPGAWESNNERLGRIGDRVQALLAEKALDSHAEPDAAQPRGERGPPEAGTERPADGLNADDAAQARAHHDTLTHHAEQVVARWKGAPTLVSVDHTGAGLP